MKPVLLDTGFLVALLDRSERRHRACVETLRQVEGPIVTCEAVIAESCYLLRGVPGAPETILANVASGVFRIHFNLEASASGVAKLLRRYSQVPMDLADACLVCMAEDNRTGRILTLDSDFQIYRWARVRPFEVMPGD